VGNPDGGGNQTTVLNVPIHSDGRRIADLVLTGRPPERPFTDQDWALALAAAGRAGQAIRNAQLYDEVRALLREREETQAQLIHTEKMSALGRLTASIAHEINNPIQSVLSCLNLAAEELEEEGRRDKLDRYLDIAEGEIERIAAIVRRMRDFYRPAIHGRQPIDPHEILEGVLALTAKQLQYANVEIRRAWSDDLPIVEADPDHLKQVFLNLTLNAADAMPQGGVFEVHTARDQLPGQGDAVRIEFRDSGVGIPPDVQARLFEPFFTTKEDGSGLGLYITYGIVESHHGQIGVESRPGQGTTFTILLPVEQPQEAQPSKSGAGVSLQGGDDRVERT
jgi:two-component system NtrC family sensor kinase